MYSNLKIVPLLIERETPCSLFSDESPKREKESLFVREKTHFMTLSLSLRACSSSSLFSLCFRAGSFSLFSLNLTKGRMERKMKREQREEGESFCLVLKPYTLNIFFLQI